MRHSLDVGWIDCTGLRTRPDFARNRAIIGLKQSSEQGANSPVRHFRINRSHTGCRAWHSANMAQRQASSDSAPVSARTFPGAQPVCLYGKQAGYRRHHSEARLGAAALEKSKQQVGFERLLASFASRCGEGRTFSQLGAGVGLSIRPGDRRTACERKLGEELDLRTRNGLDCVKRSPSQLVPATCNQPT